MGRPSDASKRLIDAACNLIFAHTYSGVSVDELCSTAGVNKSSFYHFFPSKQALVLAAIESHWQWFEQAVLAPIFLDHDVPPHERIVRFFDLIRERQQLQKQADGYMHGCPAGNLTLEMSTKDELIRVRVERFFHDWLRYFEQALYAAKEQGVVPPDLDVSSTAKALLAYFEGVMLLAKGRNDPSLISSLRSGVLLLMQCRGNLGESIG